MCIRCKKVFLSAARAHVGWNTSDFSLLFAEAAVDGLVLYGAQGGDLFLLVLVSLRL